MENLLPGYLASDEAWLLLSLPVIVALYFRFGRIWSSRNLDLALLLFLSPGLLLVRQNQLLGFGWLGIVTSILLIRLVWDCRFKRRPRVECNLNHHGLITIGIFAFAFLTVSAIASTPALPDTPVFKKTINKLSDVVKTQVSKSAMEPTQKNREIDHAVSRVVSVLAHLAVVIALIVIAAKHFRDWKLGLEMAVLYLLLPCTSYNIDKANHVIPTALLLWAVAAHRKPIAAGILTGLACGTLFFPIFLLPLWCMFYKRKEALQFAGAVLAVTAVLLTGVSLTSSIKSPFFEQIFGSIDWFQLFDFSSRFKHGFWHEGNSVFRLPVFAAFVAMLIGLILWPRKKNLEHLMAHSAAIIVGIQFWYPVGNGEFLLWYLPFVLLVVFRPQISVLEKRNHIRNGKRESKILEPTSHEPGKEIEATVDQLLP